MRNDGISNFTLESFDDIFKISMPIPSGEQVIEIALAELYPPEYHPFQVNDDAAMQRLVRSISQYGVREPALARPRKNGGYELLAGNRRKRASELAGLATMPVIIREMDDDSAVIAMVDSNLEQREKLLYSEKAWAYRVKLEALNHNGVKGDTLSVDVLVEQTGESKSQIFRIIRLTELVIALLDKVDAKQLAFNPAVELSYLSQTEQMVVAAVMDKHEIKPTLSQAVQLKKLKQAGNLTDTTIETVLTGNKKSSVEPTVLERYRRFFPPDYSHQKMNAVIERLLTDWQSGAVVI